MSTWRRLILRLHNFLRPAQAERELTREMAAHLALVEEDFLRHGMSAEEARFAARRAMGGLEQAKDRQRDTRSFVWLEDARRDVLYAIRSLRRTPSFTIVAILTLALGIGANTAVFNVVNAVLLKPLNYPTPDRIVTVTSSVSSSVMSRVPTSLWRNVSIPDFNDWRDQSTAFDALAYYVTRQQPVTVARVAEYTRLTRISPGFFQVFEITPLVGRFFTAEEEKPDGSGAAIVSRAFAQTHFGDAVRAVGQSIRVINRSVAIVGVLPVGFDFPDHTDVWIPARLDPTRTPRGQRNYLAVGRLKAEFGLERARGEMATIAARLEQQYPESNKGRGVAVTRLHDAMVGNVRLTLYLVLGAVALVLLIACANMAMLLLARATARTREIALRAALGASGGRIVRQMLAEALVLAFLAGGAGVTLALWGTPALVALVPADIPRLAEVGLEPQVLLFALITSLIVTLLFVLVPSRQMSRIDVDQALRQTAVRGGNSRRIGRPREALVLGQLAASVVLLVGGGLLIKSFIALQQVSLGFRPENVLVMRASVASADPRGQATLFFRNLLTDVSALPGVLASGATMSPPGRVDSTGAYWIDHRPEKPNPANTPSAINSIVAPGTFAALRIPLKRGRDFHDGDTLQTPRVAIVNERLAREALPGQDVIGHNIICGFDSSEPMTIVGVVGDVRQAGPWQEPSAECYMPYLQHFYNDGALSLVVRTAGDPTAFAETIRRKAQQLTPEVPVQFTTMEALVAEYVAAPRFRALLVSLFAVVALCLAVTGIFGVMAYVVGQRTTEIGLRVALGATPGEVLWLLLRRGLILTMVGLTVGVVSASLLTRFLNSVLFAVTPIDPMTYLGVAALLSVTSLLASYIPARRATKVDPLVALRCE